MVLYRLAQTALEESGLEAEVARDSLLPLMGATLKSYGTMGPLGLTGPVSRGDAGTVKGHLESIGGTALSPHEELIRSLALEALAMTRERGTLTAEAAGHMEQLLKGEGRE